MKKLLIALALSVSTSAFAGVNAYQCVIQKHYLLTHGELELAKNSSYKNVAFSVNRKTGEIVSDVIGLPTIYKIDHGSKDNSFKVLYTSVKGAPNTFIDVLVVREYEEGLNKSFTLSDGTSVKSGFCR